MMIISILLDNYTLANQAVNVNYIRTRSKGAQIDSGSVASIVALSHECTAGAINGGA